MAITVVKTSGPAAIGEGLKMATYEILLDSSYPTGGEAIEDVAADFTYCYGAWFAGNDTSADNAYKYSLLVPDSATAVTTSNVLVQVFMTGATLSTDFDEFTNTGDLKTVGNLKVVVVGV